MVDFRKLRPFTFPEQLPSLSFEPIRYRPNGLGFWSGHIPFACDLIATLRPATFVELGTQMGESYFAFCQAISENKLNCNAYAVDTWRGDRHTRPYDDVVYAEVEAHNQEHYRHFSTLLRRTFDEATEDFGDESIELLHIDGAHTYEAVSHDFKTWWPKVKPGGVVILHDSFERQWEFGVWRLLEEVRDAGLPVAEFFHSHGLGVVVKPPLTGDENVAAAFVTADDDRLKQMRNYYEVCAGNLHDRYLRYKQSRPANWEVISQVFWRVGGQPFTEEQSVQFAHVVDASPSEAVLSIPSSLEPYAGFRIALTVIPALLRLFAIRAIDHSGAVVWEQSDETGLVFAGEPRDSFMDLKLPESLRQGGRICLVMSGVNPLAAAN